MRRTTSSKSSFDVIIAGLGPVGATLAGLLGECGVETLVLEREADIHDLPRAVHFDDETMRIFQALGVAEEVAAISRINPGMRFVDAEGTLLLDWPRPQRIGPHGWHPSYRFHQPDLERILRAALWRHDSVDIRTCCDVVQVEDRGDDVQVLYKDLSSGEDHTVTTKFVVGCDGARSLVRRSMATDMEDLGFHERWLVVDAILKHPKPELGDYTIQTCNPERPTTYVRGPDNRRRWEITVLDNEGSDEICEAASVWKLLQPWISPDEAFLERTAVYTFHSTIANAWRKGRLLLAGDAAHQTPPFLGQGMCAGIRDAANLAWKLALCAEGRADHRLLDTYQAERHAHAKEYILTAVRLGGLINACGTEAALHAAFRQPDGSARMESIAPRLGEGLEAGVTVHTGTLFPQPQLADGTLLDEYCGYASVLLADPAILSGGNDKVGSLSTAGIVVVAAEPGSEIAQHLDRLEARAVLVRPDRYILGTATNADELSALIDGALPSFLNSNNPELV
jgi:3-(3-hydroxy-phenyl)propionate hydroxylase